MRTVRLNLIFTLVYSFAHTYSIKRKKNRQEKSHQEHTKEGIKIANNKSGDRHQKA